MHLATGKALALAFLFWMHGIGITKQLEGIEAGRTIQGVFSFGYFFGSFQVAVASCVLDHRSRKQQCKLHPARMPDAQPALCLRTLLQSGVFARLCLGDVEVVSAAVHAWSQVAKMAVWRQRHADAQQARRLRPSDTFSFRMFQAMDSSMLLAASFAVRNSSVWAKLAVCLRLGG